MSTFKLTLQYDGTGLVGWQRQASGISVQGLVEDALGRLEGHPVAVTGAGRTDAGVHAIGQVASVSLDRAIESDELGRALNGILPTTVRVVRVDAADLDFNARFAAKAKTYRYRVLNDVVASPFELRHAWHVPRRLDDTRMVDACDVLIGQHDFGAFRSTGSDVQTTVRTVRRFTLRRVPVVPVSTVAAPPAGDDRIIEFDITGDGFLRHMVRAIVGTVVEVGAGQRAVGSVQAALDSGRRDDAGPTAPAHGLFLVDVEF
jgi:tRNA pseudouridine38-40 synthase